MSYLLDHYPVELIDVIHIQNGQRVTVRPFLPQDANILQTFVRALSNESRRDRFFSSLRELSNDLLTGLTCIDYHRHLALLAEVFLDGTEMIVGEARYAIEGGRDRAELAISVAEGWRRLGIARLLLNRLEERAVAEGVGILVGDTQSSNQSAQYLMLDAGYSLRPHPADAGVLRGEKTLLFHSSAPQAFPGGTRLAAAPDAVLFRHLAGSIRPAAP